MNNQLNYQAIGKRFLKATELPEGVLKAYERDDTYSTPTPCSTINEQGKKSEQEEEK